MHKKAIHSSRLGRRTSGSGNTLPTESQCGVRTVNVAPAYVHDREDVSDTVSVLCRLPSNVEDFAATINAPIGAE